MRNRNSRILCFVLLLISMNSSLVGQSSASGTFGNDADGTSRLQPDPSISLYAGVDRTIGNNRLLVSPTYFYTRLREVISFKLSDPPRIAKTWDDAELATLELPLAEPGASPVHISGEYYYRVPVRPIYKSYPVYAPTQEPQGYMEWLKQQEPEIVFDVLGLKSTADWIKAGEIVFDAPIGYGSSFKLSQVRDAEWYRRTGVPVARDGIMPFSRYVIRKKGEIEVGGGACLMCHMRVMPDGSVIKGAQGNFPADRVLAYNLRSQAAQAREPEKFLEAIRLGQRAFFAVPWLRPDPSARIDQMSIQEIASAYEAIPPGVTTRVNLSLFFPAQIPGLIGIQTRRYLDHTGLVRQRSIADLMRYAALVQGANSLDRFRDFKLIDKLPDPNKLLRYSDEQLYALARYLYSLKPPPNPNVSNALAARGQKIFEREGCIRCHTPPEYTSNKLVPVEGFKPPEDQSIRPDILAVHVGTDPNLALRTRKGTGFYKIPSLKGVWYRSPLEHSGSVATLEDWFDSRRTHADYIPTGYKGYGVNRRAVKGHPFGLELSHDERRALLAFLRTL